MLEFNIDKQGGIKLHTCERKSRWCKFWLWLSWLSMLAFLGWLFWNGFLTLEKQGDRQSSLSKMSLTNSLAAPLKNSSVPIITPEVKAVIPDCPKNESTNATSNKELEASCNEKISALNKQLKELSDLKKSNLELKVSASTLEQSKANLIKEKKELDKKLIEKASQNEKLAKQLSLASDKKGIDPDLAEKLYYYEQILDVKGNKQAVVINHFVLKKLKKPNHYRFQMVLGRLGQSLGRSEATGTFEVFLKGKKRIEVINSSENSQSADSKSEAKPTAFTKEAVTYKHSDLMPDDDSINTSTFTFKYYQNVERDIVLPEYFELESISVGVKPKSLSSVRKNYEWKDLDKLSFKEIK